MSKDQIKLMMQALGEQIFEKEIDPRGTISMLISETIKFRDKLVEETSEILTVDDTRKALEALEEYLKGKKLPKNLTSEQKSLTQIYIDRLTLFKKT